MLETRRLLKRKFSRESAALTELYIVGLEKEISECREQIKQLESSYALRVARRIPFGSQIRKLLASKRSHEMLICLTIDDGPSEKAGELLDYLMSKQIGAILFCRGDHLQAREELAVRAIHDGHIIGNHSYDHPHFSTLSKEQARVQIARTDELIDQIYLKSGVQRPAKYFRFPHGDGGANNEAIETNQQLLREFGYWSPIHSPRRDWGWDVDVMDWRVEASNAAQKLEFAKQRLKTLHPGAVLDLHDHSMNLEVGLFQSICDSISELGFTFHTNKNLQDQIMNHHPLG